MEPDYRQRALIELYRIEIDFRRIGRQCGSALIELYRIEIRANQT